MALKVGGTTRNAQRSAYQAGSWAPDAIVVLGCPLGPGGNPAGASQRRVQQAIEVYRQGVAPWVVASGGRCWHGVAEAQGYRQALVLAKVPSAQVIMELESLTTAHNARAVARVFRSRGFQHAALVTCDWHMPRALRLFDAAGIVCTPMPAASPRVSCTARVWRSLRERVSLLL